MPSARSSAIAIAGVFAAAIFGQFVCVRPASAQVLGELRQDVRVGEPSAPAAPAASDGTSSSNSKGHSDSDDGPDYSPLIEPAFRVLSAPFWLPVTMLGDEELQRDYFLRYPYWNDLPGSMLVPQPGDPRHRSWAGEASIEYADSFDDLSRLGAHLRISTANRFDVETNYNWFQESTPTGHDQLSMGDVDLLFRFAQSETLQFRSGFGANWLDDKQGVNAGFNFRYGVEWFSKRPWTAKALIDLGELGKSDLIHVRTTVGVDLQRWELFTGYDYRKIGDVRIDGPLVGMQMRF